MYDKKLAYCRLTNGWEIYNFYGISRTYLTLKFAKLSLYILYAWMYLSILYLLIITQTNSVFYGNELQL